MCVEINPNEKVHDVVLGYKLVVNPSNRGCLSLTVRHGYEFSWDTTKRILYRWNTSYRDKDGAPGIQAFVHRSDAELSQTSWQDFFGSSYECVVLPVLLYDAQQGIIQGMSHPSDGMQGWSARGILIPQPWRKT